VQFRGLGLCRGGMANEFEAALRIASARDGEAQLTLEQGIAGIAEQGAVVLLARFGVLF
jgi:hypothetical protein